MRSMFVVHVSVHVKPSDVPAFLHATRANAASSLLEPGVVRFDIVQDLEDEGRFLLVEVYKDESAAARHKETQHYATWRDSVADMMASPRTSKKFKSIFPEPFRWETPIVDASLADTLPGFTKAPF